ncbi:sulfite exporter TauE/SafE family protein [Treponema bryantii]|uniref:urease accessory protein UreH domain-containing protein n=1 Tax=Treponema bryantii TaxID=163 RepID=UPI002B299458|nr:hypothetical protein TRBR_23260 [Treponema bryantii]
MNKHYYVKIAGIYCAHCRTVISSFIKKADLDADIKISGNIAKIKSDKLSDTEIIQAVTQAGYTTKSKWICSSFNKWKFFQILEFAGFALLIFLLRLILKSLLGYDILNVIPVIDTKLTFAGLLLAGFLTSFHCIGMCGAINLAVSKNSRKSLLYNGGRIFCYTAIGFFAGLFGKTISINQSLLCVIILLLSLFMIFLGFSMAGFFSVNFNHFSLPSKLKTSSVFLTGFLNGFMPCTPLITMQLYAVSTASPFKGAFAMLLFGLGTLPLMLGFSFVQNFLGGKKALLQKILAVFILLMGLAMFLRGLTGLGINTGSTDSNLKKWKTAQINSEKTEQKIEINLSYDGYEDFAVQEGIPVTLIINAEEDYITGCNNRVISNDFDFDVTLVPGKNEICFLPDKNGTFIYSCWMYMLKNKIYVYEE